MSEASPMLEHALEAARAGLRVHPVHYPTATGEQPGCSCPRGADCPTPGKHPMIDGWQDDATTDEESVREIWAELPDANVGIATGAGVFALDVDGDEGARSLAALEAERGELPETRCTATGRGWHFYFRCPPERTPGCAPLAHKVDVRGAGGNLVGPGSLHASGRHYALEGDAPIAEAPEWLLALLESKRAVAPAPIEPSEPGAVEARWARLSEPDRAYVLDRARQVARDYPPAVSGQGGHSTTFKLAVRLARVLGLPVPEALKIMREDYNPRCRPPWSEAELAHKVADAAQSNAVPLGDPIGDRAAVDLVRQRAAASAPPAAPAAAAFNLTDAGNAERFAGMHGERVRHVRRSKQWLAWDGRRWARDDLGAVNLLAKETARSIMREAADEADPDRRRRLAAHALKSESARGLAAMLDLARSEPKIAAAPEQFDRDDFLLCVENGTIDLRTGRLREHRREDMITRLAPVAFDPTARAPLWEHFLDRVLPNAGVRGFMQRYAGYCLTASVAEQVLAILYGVGQNGKGVFVETLRAALGDYARVADAAALLVKKGEGPRNDVAALAGARLVTASETESGKKLAEGLVKEITGGDRVTARFLFGEFFEFKPSFKIVLSTNYRPAVSGTDVGIWRRIKLVPFGVVIPDAERDEHLAAKLLGELPGILNWALEGCLAWQRDGLGEPAEVRDATEDYRHEMDPLGDFLAEECDLRDEDARTTTAALYDAYRSWCARHGAEPLDQRRFVDQLPSHGMRPTKIGHARKRGWTGVQLVTERARLVTQQAAKVLPIKP